MDKLKSAADLLSACDKLLNTFGKPVDYFIGDKKLLKSVKIRKEALEIFGKNTDDYDIYMVDRQVAIIPKEQATLSNDALEKLKEFFENFIINEIKKQSNLESIIEKAYDLLESENTQASSEPIDDDWKTIFENNAKNITKEETQTLWAKVLAREVAQPNTISRRTLHALLNLDKKDAELFQIAAKCSFRDRDHRYLFSKKENLIMYGLKNHLFDTIKLDELNLISNSDNSFALAPNDRLDFLKDDKFYTITNASQKELHLSFFTFTSIGNELCSLFDITKDFTDEELKSIFKLDTDVKLSIHERIDDNTYKTNPLKTL